MDLIVLQEDKCKENVQLTIKLQQLKSQMRAIQAPGSDFLSIGSRKQAQPNLDTLANHVYD